MPTTIAYEPPDSLLIISGLAVVCLALLFVERYALRRASRDAAALWLRRFAIVSRGVGIWWLLLGGSTFLIFLAVYVLMRYQENASGDISMLLVRVFLVAGVLALVTLGVTLALLLAGVGALLCLKSRGDEYAGR